MPIFGPSQFDRLVEKATNETNVAEDWQSMLECCDYINAQQNTRSLEPLRSIMRRMSHPHPNVSIQAVILLDSCVGNCGRKFHLEVASREFLTEARKLLEKGHPKVVERFKLMIKKWSENEFKSDTELTMIPTFYNQLVKDGYDFTDPTKPQLPKDPNIVISDQEEEDIIKALELSMKDMKKGGRNSASSSDKNPSTSTTSLYPDINSTFPSTNIISSSSSRSKTNTTNSSTTATTLNDQQYPKHNGTQQRESFKVRALYDFEAAEENELTFKAGEIILVTDDHDENWWTGNNHRGEGLFPANFVSKDLNVPVDETLSASNGGKSVQFDDDVRVKFVEEDITEVDEVKIDRLLLLIHEADPTGVQADSAELLMLEDQCGRMGKLIDKELERLDRIQVALSGANRQLNESIKEFLYLNQ